MNRKIEFLTEGQYLRLSEEARSRYIESILDDMIEEDDALVPIEEEEEVFTGEVQESESEDWDNDNEIPAAIDTPMQIEQDVIEDESDNETDMVEENAPTSSTTESMIARDGTQWQPTPPVCQQIRSHNIIRTRSGPLRMTESMTGMQCFKSYFTIEMVDIIVRHTNKKANSTYDAYNAANPTKRQLKWRDTTVAEIYAFIGMLIMAGANHSNDENARDLWTQLSHPLFRATMGLNRFWDLIRFIRFDDARTRNERQRTDKAAPIRDVWIMLNANLAKYYVPTENLTIDEQLYPYRGRTKFTQYIPSKPAKYGIKVWWICDAKNSYPLHGQIYTGKQDSGREIGVGERVVRDLVGPYYGSGRNITMDNFFTTLPLAKQLISVKLSIVGTLRRNKAYIPTEMKDDKRWTIGTSKFGFHEKVTMVTYKQRKTNSVIMLSTMHDDATVEENGKPEIINFYNKTKGGVDVMDQTLREYTTQRHTKRWPLSFLYNMLDVSAFAAYTIFYENNTTVPYQTTRRKRFLRNLAEDLCAPIIEERVTNRQVTRLFSTKTAIESFLGRPLETVTYTEQPSTSTAASTDGRKPITGSCYLCASLPDKRRRKTRKVCSVCKKPVCDQHTKTISKCFPCFNNDST